MDNSEVVTWTEVRGDGPLVATAIHDGQGLRDEVAAIIKLDNAARLREEDPFTSRWVDVAATQLVALRSRFEVDLNRPRDQAVYIKPEDCWGLDVWNTKPSGEIVERSLRQYDAYYANLSTLLSEKVAEHGHFVVYDIHSYNHRRDGDVTPAESAEENPEVNIGTGSLYRERWGPLVDRFIADLRAFNFMGRRLDVRENVKFKGGNQVKWIHENFPSAGCGLAIEFKKFWMDEWTGEVDEAAAAAIGDALHSTVPGVLEELAKL